MYNHDICGGALFLFVLNHPYFFTFNHGSCFFVFLVAVDAAAGVHGDPDHPRRSVPAQETHPAPRHRC